MSFFLLWVIGLVVVTFGILFAVNKRDGWVSDDNIVEAMTYGAAWPITVPVFLVFLAIRFVMDKLE